MSSMFGELFRAALPATVSVRHLVATTPSFWVVYGDGTQSSAAMGSSPVAVASHVPGTCFPCGATGGNCSNSRVCAGSGGLRQRLGRRLGGLLANLSIVWELMHM